MYPRVLRTIAGEFRRLRVWYDREELASAALVGVCRGAMVYDGTMGCSWPAYADKRVRWAILDAMKLEGRRQRFGVEVFADVEVVCEGGQVAVDSRDAFDAMVGLARPSDRVLVVMRYRDGLGVGEIAEALNLSSQRVRNRLSDARSAIRRLTA